MTGGRRGRAYPGATARRARRRRDPTAAAKAGGNLEGGGGCGGAGLGAAKGEEKLAKSWKRKRKGAEKKSEAEGRGIGFVRSARWGSKCVRARRGERRRVGDGGGGILCGSGSLWMVVIGGARSSSGVSCYAAERCRRSDALRIYFA